jgi:hypothetical protein
MTENQIAELANIGRQYIYLDEVDKCRLSHGGVLEIIKRYEELRTPDVAGQSERLVAFKQFCQENYGIAISDRIIDEFERYGS